MISITEEHSCENTCLLLLYCLALQAVNRLRLLEREKSTMLASKAQIRARATHLSLSWKIMGDRLDKPKCKGRGKAQFNNMYIRNCPRLPFALILLWEL